MCGIIGYTGNENSVPILVEGLRALEYRGYDSAGISVQEDKIITVKTKGRLDDLAKKLEEHADLSSGCGIGHTRWATHGEPSDRNSHPHRGKHLSMVHNGIIENYAEIADMLKKIGYVLESETDTEIAAKLIDSFYDECHDPLKAIFSATEIIRGSYAFAIIFEDIPHKIYAIRKDNPLIVASSENGGFIASDIPAILKYTRTYFRIDENVVAELDGANINFYSSSRNKIAQPIETVDWDIEQAQKGGFPHFMVKEINDEPSAVRKTVSAYQQDDLPHFGIEKIDSDFICKFKSINIIACGTAMHAGLVGKYVIEKFARVPVNVDVASEFRYRDPILSSDDLVILVSQSGETADTLAALRLSKEAGAYTLAIVNVVGSSIAREADSVIYTLAGPEISVASTKAYSVQCAVVYMFALRLALARNKISVEQARKLCVSLQTSVPDAITNVIKFGSKIRSVSKKYINAEHIFFIGRGVDSYLGTEGSLKLKEISYIHCEAYAAGELKHGTISLISEGTPVVAITTQSNVCEKTISGIREVKARGAVVLSICTRSIAEEYNIPCDDMIVIPDTEIDDIDNVLDPFACATALQLLAYHVSELKGLDVDKPRNLAKSVTVE